MYSSFSPLLCAKPSLPLAAKLQLVVFTHGAGVGFDEDGTQVFIGRDVIFKAFYFACVAAKFLPERDPVNIAAAAHFIQQQIKERLVDILFTSLFGSNDMRIRGMLQYIMDQIVSTA